MGLSLQGINQTRQLKRDFNVPGLLWESRSFLWDVLAFAWLPSLLHMYQERIPVRAVPLQTWFLLHHGVRVEEGIWLQGMLFIFTASTTLLWISSSDFLMHKHWPLGILLPGEEAGAREGSPIVLVFFLQEAFQAQDKYSKFIAIFA